MMNATSANVSQNNSRYPICQTSLNGKQAVIGCVVVIGINEQEASISAQLVSRKELVPDRLRYGQNSKTINNSAKKLFDERELIFVLSVDPCV